MKTLWSIFWFAFQLVGGCYLTYAAIVAIWPTDRGLAVIVGFCLAAMAADTVVDLIKRWRD